MIGFYVCYAKEEQESLNDVIIGESPGVPRLRRGLVQSRACQCEVK